MTITASCPHCAAAFTFDDSQVGQAGSCPACQGQITLAVPAQTPPQSSAPTPPAPQVPVRKAPETRKEYLARVRKETSYGTARGLLKVGSGLLLALGALCMVGGVLSFAGVGVNASLALTSGIMGLVLGFILIVLAIGCYQASVVVFDIADVLIEERK